MTRRAAIIGGGVIGGGWLARFVLNGWDVTVYDPDPEAARKIEAVLQNARRSFPMLYDGALARPGRFSFSTSVAQAVENADWVQESVPERLDIKHQTLREIERAAPEKAIIGSSTSGFKPSQLQAGMSQPERTLVTHPFNPVYLLPLVEVVPGAATAVDTIDEASEILSAIGMYPLVVRKEIDAHIADRFLEAVWREGLWLIKDGIATTREIDDAIRYGFGLRWAQMGLFETYRIAGGEAGMKHFIAQFGPCLEWPWTKLMDVPELTDDLVAMISQQSDEQSGDLSIRELERLRDDNLVAMLRALKGQNAAAGALLNAHQSCIQSPVETPPDQPLISVRRCVPVDWVDGNGYMKEGCYGQVFCDATEAVLQLARARGDETNHGFSFVTVKSHMKFERQICTGESLTVETVVAGVKASKLKLRHRMTNAQGNVLAKAKQTLRYINHKTGKPCMPTKGVSAALISLAAAHSTFVRQPDREAL